MHKIYTNIKRLMYSYRSFSDKPVYLVAATLRPETMYGQTNCWVHPDINYIAYTLSNGDVYISTERAARNMAYQDFFKEEGKISIALKLTGKVIFLLSLIKKTLFLFLISIICKYK